MKRVIKVSSCIHGDWIEMIEVLEDGTATDGEVFAEYMEILTKNGLENINISGKDSIGFKKGVRIPTNNPTNNPIKIVLLYV